MKKVAADTRPFSATEAYRADSQLGDRYNGPGEAEKEASPNGVEQSSDTSQSAVRVIINKLPPLGLQESIEERVARELAEFMRDKETPRPEVTVMKQPPPEVLQEWADRCRRRPLKAARDTTRTPARQFHSGNDRLPRLNLHPSDSCSTKTVGRKHRYLPSIIHLRAAAGRESQCYKHPRTKSRKHF